MKLGSLKSSERDGTLVVVSANLKHAVKVPQIATTLQAALDDWVDCEAELRSVARLLENGQCREAFMLNPKILHAPLPRAYQWADASAYLFHVELVRRARGAELPPELLVDPLMYQGGSDRFLAPDEPIHVSEEAWGIDMEGEVAVITDDVPMGVSVGSAANHIKLVTLANDVSLRNLIPKELAKGFGFFHSKPPTAFAPVAVTPDALGSAWRDGKLHRALHVSLNGDEIGHADAGTDMQFGFPELIAHAAKTRPLSAGTIIGSGTVSNRDRSSGSSCLAEIRTLELLEKGKPTTPFMHFGDRVRIEMLDDDGNSIFGAIDQTVVKAEPFG
ncbi:MAG TPA: fumarylacetoacetate hydrolase family protein [Alphaproteobacteria bacterium]|nr:fumarylacetoacetate hydrolase family protein [Alphaproteobacteria bacterium]